MTVYIDKDILNSTTTKQACLESNADTKIGLMLNFPYHQVGWPVAPSTKLNVRAITA